MTLDINLLKKLDDFKKFILDMIPVASDDDTPLSDNNVGSIGNSFEYARSDHTHPFSTGHYVDTITNTITNSSNQGTVLGSIKANTTTKGTIYHPKNLNSDVNSGLYKITVDTDGHIVATTNVAGTDLPSHTHSEYTTSQNVVTTINQYLASSIITDTGSTTKYPSVKAVEDYIEYVIGDTDDWLSS